MAASIPNLQVLNKTTEAKELDLASEVFHRVNRIIPENQTVLTIPPNCLVREAVEIMRRHGYSQIPVVQDGEVLGVFSFRSFAQGAAKQTWHEFFKQKIAPGDLRVDEFFDRVEYARLKEEMSRVIEALDRDDCILIGVPERLVGILTPMDLLRYFHRVASPFVMVSEIELALRALIRIALSPEKIVTAAKRCLLSLYGSEDKIPTTLEDMSFDNYRLLISHGENWKEFEPIFGGNRS